MKKYFVLLALTLAFAMPAFAGGVITVDKSGAYLTEQAHDGTITMKAISGFSVVQSAHAEDAPVMNKPLVEPSPKPEPQSNGEALKMLGDVYQAVKAGNWGLAISLFLMLLVWAARMFLLPKLNPQAVPLVVAILGVIGGISSGIAGGAPVVASILMGLFVGAAASGLWEQIFKHILPSPQKPAPAPEAGIAPQA